MIRTLVLLALVFVPVAVATDQPGPVDYGPLPTISGPSVESRIEPRFSRAASLVSGGRAVEARCWSVTDWSRLRDDWLAATNGSFDLFSGLAYVNPNDPIASRVHLSSSVCASLVALTYKDAWPTARRKNDLAFAVVTLAHEAQHVRGIAAEPTAECYGMQRARIVGRSLGLTLKQANELVALYFKQGYPRRPTAYVSNACRTGGALDLNLTSVFP